VKLSSASQRRSAALSLSRSIEAVGVVPHLGEHRPPVADRHSNVGQNLLDLSGDFLTAARIHAIELDVDDRFRIALADLHHLPALVAGNLDDRVKHPVDRDIARRDRARHAVDQERHVLVDDDHPDAPPARLAAGRFDLHRGRAGRPNRCGRRDELSRLALLLSVEPLGFARKGVGRQRIADGIDQRLRQARLGRHLGIAPTLVVMGAGYSPAAAVTTRTKQTFF
jgi:hypothetical protein